MEANLARMERAAPDGEGFDLVIVSTSSARAAAWWADRLARTRGDVCATHARIAVVVEDRPAGNGGGTLLAVRRAGIDVLAALREGQRVALYHTAGKGTRLAPLPLAEAGDKPRVTLPGLAAGLPITMLEAVIRQTAIYAAPRPGRLSVFWGDQVFLPSVPPAPATHAADLLVRRLPAFDLATWAQRSLHRYGVVAIGAGGDAVQMEKIDHRSFQDLVAREGMAPQAVAVSLGSFSLSAELLAVLLDSFGDEHLDADPHFWMPATLSAAAYAACMPDPDQAVAQHARMAEVKRRLGGAHLLGVSDTGDDGAWWDFGTLNAWWDNVRGVRGDARLRRILAAPDPVGGVLALGCAIDRNNARDSVLVGVEADRVDVADAVLVGVRAPHVQGGGGLLYNVVDERPVAVQPGEAVVDVILGDRRVRVRCPLTGAGWDHTVDGNPASFAEMHARLTGRA